MSKLSSAEDVLDELRLRTWALIDFVVEWGAGDVDEVYELQRLVIDYRTGADVLDDRVVIGAQAMTRIVQCAALELAERTET